jgi:mannobiose 2-epimerase
MIVSQARHTWTPAKAAHFYPNEAVYRSTAQHGFTFLRDVMWDKTHGGFYTWVERSGKPKKDEYKTAYGNAFGIYALAAYYQLTGDTSALNLAKTAFHWLEKNSHDPKQKGYFQHLTQEGKPVTTAIPSATGANKEIGYKDQNSSIHLLEAFTELYTVWPDELVRERLQEMFLLIRDKIVTEKGYLTLFLTPEWQPVSYRDSSETARKANYSLDHVSFGHDVETAYLLLEASHTLGMKHDQKTMQIAKKMVDHALANGWDNEVGGFYDRGYYFKGKDKIDIIHDAKNWWTQAEALNTLLLMADEFPQDPHNYYSKFEKQWSYIQKYLLDTKHGGWYAGGLDKEPKQATGSKAHAWKACYHESRSLMNCLQRLRPDKTPPSAPLNVQVKKVNNGQILQWGKSTDNGQLLGYDVYQNGKRIGFTPLTQFVVATNGKTGTANKYYIKAKDLAGNEVSSKEVSL